MAPKCFNQKKEPVKAQPRGNGGNGGHKVNMVELNSNSFRLDSSLPIVNFITFSSDRFSGANIHICTDRSCFKSYQEQCGENVSQVDDCTREIKET